MATGGEVGQVMFSHRSRVTALEDPKIGKFEGSLT